MNQQAYELYRRSRYIALGGLPSAQNTELTLWLPSIGSTLIDSLDELVHLGRIEPQLAMKILQSFDKIVADVLTEKVKTRLTFKVQLPDLRAPGNVG